MMQKVTSFPKPSAERTDITRKGGDVATDTKPAACPGVLAGLGLLSQKVWARSARPALMILQGAGCTAGVGDNSPYAQEAATREAKSMP